MSETLFFGPPAGAAGTRVQYTDSSPQVRSGAYGITAIVGPFQKGLANVVSRIRDKAGFQVVNGRVLDDDYSGVAAHAFLDVAKGAGQLHSLRVVSSGGLAAAGKEGQLYLFARDVLASRIVSRGVGSTNERAIALRANALSPGDWSGPAFEYTGTLNDGTISGATIDLGAGQSGAFLADELKGCKFKIGTFSYEFTILSNTAAGVLTLDRGFSGYTPAGAGVLFQIYRANEDADGLRMEAAVRITDDPTQPASLFGAAVASDGKPGRKFVGLDLGNLTGITAKINEVIPTGYAELTFDDDSQSVADPALPESRPANWAGIVQPASLTAAGADVTVDHGKARVESGKVFVQVHELIIDTAAGGRPKLSAAPTIPTDCIPHVWELTFSAANAFSATLLDPYTQQAMCLGAQLPVGATGAAYPGATFAHPRLASFTVAADATIQAGTKVRLYILPFEPNLAQRGAVLYAAAWSGTGYTPTATDAGSNPAKPGITKAWRVIGNGADWVKLAADLTTLPTDLQAPKAPWIRGTDAGATIDTTGGLTFKYKVTVDGIVESEVTLTIVEQAPAVVTKAAVAAAFQAQDALGADELAFYADDDNKLVVVLKRGDAGALVKLKATNGTVNALAGIADDTEGTGQDGAVVRLDYDQGLRAARPEAHAVAVADLQTALTVDPNGALRQWVESQPGLVTLYLPGINDADTVQTAIDFAETVGCWVRFDLPDNLADELAARGWLQANITPKRVFSTCWPAWGATTKSPRGKETVPLGGAILGAEAAWANDPTEGRGFHKAPAGQHVLLSPYVTALVRNTSAVTPASLIQRPRTDQVTLNEAGIQPVMESGPAIFMFGDEGPNQLFNGTFWLHKQKAMLHIAALLRANFDAIIFHANTPSNRVDLVRSLRALTRPLYEAGWFIPLEDGLPQSFDNCVRIQCDDTNNPIEVQNLGKLVAALAVRIVNTTKELEFQLGTSGVAVAAAA